MSDVTLDLKVGDKVRLTGEAWDGYGTSHRGDIVAVERIDAHGMAWGPRSVGSLTAMNLVRYGDDSLIGFEVEKVELEPRVLADDIRDLTDTMLNHFDQAGFSYAESRALLKAFINEFLG